MPMSKIQELNILVYVRSEEDLEQKLSETSLYEFHTPQLNIPPIQSNISLNQSYSGAQLVTICCTVEKSTVFTVMRSEF